MFYVITYYKPRTNSWGKRVGSSYQIVSEHDTIDEAREAVLSVTHDFGADFECPPVIAQQVQTSA